MKVKVTYLGLIRHKVGKKEEEYELAESSSLADLLNRIAEKHDMLKGMIGAEKESTTDPTLILTLNGSAINLTERDKNKIMLKDGDQLTLMTVIGGGYCFYT